MTSTPPSLDILRALVRGVLPSAERPRVERWLAEHADETVASVLDALSVEWREAQADARLPSPLRELSAALWPLAEEGHGDVDPDPTDVVELMRGPARVIDVLTVELVPARPRRVRLRAQVTAAGPFVVGASDDLGAIHTLFAGQVSAGQIPIAHDYDVEPEDGRVTFWLLPGVLPALTPAALLGLVEDGRRAGAARAVRVTPAFFEP